MAEVVSEPEFIGLAEFLVGLVRETGEGILRAQLGQSENESELRKLASLDVEAAAEKLVTDEAALMRQDDLLAESGADANWTGKSASFVKLVELRLGLTLVSARDYSRRGLTAAGRARILAAARTSIAAEQLLVVHRLLGEGTHRVKVASGSFAVKLEMRSRRSPSDAAPMASTGPARAVQKQQAPAVKLRDSLSLDKPTIPDISISVRPAQRADGEAAGVFAELKINFIVV